MDARTITGALPTYPRSAVRFRQLATFLTADETYLTAEYSAQTNDAGDFSIAVPTPDTGTVAYLIELPNGASAGINLAAGAATTLEILLASAFAVGTAQDVVQTAIDSHALLRASTTVFGHAKVDGTTITSAAGVLSAVAAEVTQAELDAHAALTTAAHGGIPLLAAANTFTADQTIHAKAAIGASATFSPVNPAFPTSTYTTLLTVSDEASITTIPGGALGIYANVYSSAKFAPTAAHSVTIQGMASNVELAATGAGSYGQVNAIFASVVKNDAVAGSAINAISGGTYNQGGATVPLLASIYGYLTQNSVTPSVVTDARILQAEANVGNLNTVTTLQGVYSRLTAASGAIIGTFSAFRGRMNSINAGAVITNAYGLWVDKMVGGSTIQRAILTDGGTVEHKTGTATIIGLLVKGFTAQSANLQEWQDTSSNILSTISENGYFTTRKIAAPADAELAASELAFWFDSTDGAGKLMIKAKTANGTVVAGNVALT